MFKDSSELFFIILLGVAACGFVIGTTVGVKLTRSDIYSRCMSDNKAMTYEEVHKLCTERSR